MCVYFLSDCPVYPFNQCFLSLCMWMYPAVYKPIFFKTRKNSRDMKADPLSVLVQTKQGNLLRIRLRSDNRAERALIPSVIYRKVSGGSRSGRGAEIYTKIYSIYYISKLRGKNFIEDTPSIIKGSPNPG